MARLLAVLLAAGLLAACSDSNSDRAATVEPTTTTTAVRPHAQAELQPALLAVTDMPMGFAVDTSPSDGGKKGVCGKPSVTTRVPSTAEAKANFSKGTLGPFVQEIIASYPSADEAKRYISEMKADASSCTSYDDKNSDGTTDKVTISAMSFPVIGDETLALRISSTGSGDLIFMRKSNVIVYVATAGLTVDASLDEPIARKAMEKASSTLQI